MGNASKFMYNLARFCDVLFDDHFDQARRKCFKFKHKLNLHMSCNFNTEDLNIYIYISLQYLQTEWKYKGKCKRIQKNLIHHSAYQDTESEPVFHHSFQILQSSGHNRMLRIPGLKLQPLAAET